MTQAKDSYSSSTVAASAHVSLRMLQWWDERKLISPTKSGHRRFYSPRAALMAMIVGELKRKGLTLFQIRKTLPGIEKAITTRYNKLSDLLLLLDDAGNVTATIVPAVALTTLVEANSAMWAIHVGDLANRLPQIPTAESRESAA